MRDTYSDTYSRSFRSLTLGALLACAGASTLAGKPDWVEDGKHGKSAKHQKHEGDDRQDYRQQEMRPSASSSVSINIQIGGYFAEPQRIVVREYYQPRMRAGKCPPGLKKKHNGCRPPGLAKAWHRGQPLPPEVVVYPVPASVQVRLGVPPSGHKFVRVASDILLIAVGSGMVIDAIEDLGAL
jgi:Ni/Co efflux regulator RcnB